MISIDHHYYITEQMKVFTMNKYASTQNKQIRNKNIYNLVRKQMNAWTDKMKYNNEYKELFMINNCWVNNTKSKSDKITYQEKEKKKEQKK